ncbi:methylated-DNA--[protein]-cysteine S-methyltransferase [Campylobacter sp. MIT 99-7217]|uniref:methylated-DNA--[protein]-cysteine S-methyltransferase n=1 Tax=Campylobacter sp. MIT 99-7217 TaxID=535091 RepID=UPI00115C01F5|nr:methylated-DNA--[protein]-cysteine S-methyltransferase [Campylobacter sp. MIT 99-7217]TQR34713.1 methylated-DNA--[protein]-cysteine S-methyltransferase [Campylobacter sp. MIT 99-7217]
MFKLYYLCEFSYILLKSDTQALISAEFCEKKQEEENSCELLEKAFYQLDMYFKRQLFEFKLPLKEQGNGFEAKVYKALCEIPYGKTATYKEIALKIGHKNAFRAVGNANSKNQLPIFVPCHRVVGVNSLGGYTSALKNSLDIKRYLLRLEGIKL